MKNNTQSKLALFRKLKYGVTALILTIAVVAVAVIGNVIYSSLAYSNNWYIDLTENKVYGLTDGGRALLDEIDEEVTIHFFAPFDKLESNSYTKMAFELVKEISAEYDNVTYDYIDPVKNPSALIKYKSATTTVINQNHMVVEAKNGTQHRMMSFTNLFTFDSAEATAPWAFNGEKKIITAISQVTQLETPVAYFTNTHGETLSASMLELFYDAGYEIQPIDLTKQEIDKKARIIVISNPVYDFEGISEDTAGRKSEIEKIDDFLDGFGNLIVFMDPETGELPELETFLAEWGIAFDDSQLRDPENSVDTQYRAIVGQYSMEETMGGSLVEALLKTGTPPKTIIRDARPINLLFDIGNGRQTSTAVYSSPKAQKYVDGKPVEEGQYSLVALSCEERYIDNVKHQAFVLAIGSSEFIEDQYLTQSYGNGDIIHTFMKTTGKIQVPVDLMPKPFEETALILTGAEAARWTGVITAVVPALVLVIGLVIFIRRKHA